jgi:hypothetical protein
VINLGTNDATRISKQLRLPEPTPTLAAIDHRFDMFSKEFPRTTCVLFVTVNTHNPSWSPRNAAAINGHIRMFAHVVDWDKAWRSSYFDRPDDPHPNEVGRQALLQIEDQAIAKCPRRSG